MNEKLKTFLSNAWNEPRRFFFWLTIFCISGLVLAGIADSSDQNLPSQLPPLALMFVVCLVIGVGVGALAFILAWIPPVRRLFTWMLRLRFFVLACVVTLVAIFYTEENWRGRRAWKQFKAEHEAKGEKFDLAQLAPPPVPDDQNFAMSPLWVEEIAAVVRIENAQKWYGDKVAALGHTNFIRRLEMPPELWSALEFKNASEGNWQTAEKSNLKLRQEYYRKLAAITNYFPAPPHARTPAEDVLTALSKYDSTIEELRRAAALPNSRFPLRYDEENSAAILLPHLAVLKSCTITLRLRAIAELQAGQTDKAFDDVKLLFRLTDSIRNEPILISHLIRIAMLHVELQPIWEGLADRKWSDAQLAALNSELARMDFLADYEFCMKGERAFANGIIDYLQHRRNEIGNMDVVLVEENVARSRGPVEELEDLLNRGGVYFIPAGWFERNKLAICRMHEKYFLPVINVEKRIVSPAIAKRSEEALGKISRTPYDMFSGLLLPALNKAVQKSARAQSAIDLARVGCALERYRLAHGHFPETLAALSPQFVKSIPHDIMSGQPLKYRRTDDGLFVLYSVGWNEADDGGKIAFAKGGKALDQLQGDWVWRY